MEKEEQIQNVSEFTERLIEAYELTEQWETNKDDPMSRSLAAVQSRLGAVLQQAYHLAGTPPHRSNKYPKLCRLAELERRYKDQLKASEKDIESRAKLLPAWMVR